MWRVCANGGVYGREGVDGGCKCVDMCYVVKCSKIGTFLWSCMVGAHGCPHVVLCGVCKVVFVCGMVEVQFVREMLCGNAMVYTVLLVCVCASGVGVKVCCVNGSWWLRLVRVASCV